MQSEPNAALPLNRLDMLYFAKDKGIETWASIEPVIIPSESLSIMREAIPYVDEFKIGMWNHDPRANDIDWAYFVRRTEALMVKHGKRFMFKQELQRYREVTP
jgi:DNA repair photolyase